jgi:hypothetical protein
MKNEASGGADPGGCQNCPVMNSPKDDPAERQSQQPPGGQATQKCHADHREPDREQHTQVEVARSEGNDGEIEQRDDRAARDDVLVDLPGLTPFATLRSILSASAVPGQEDEGRRADVCDPAREELARRQGH